MANNSKQVLMTVIISLVTSVLASVITASIVSNNVLLGPTVPPTQIINATSCDADYICETNNLIAEGAEIVNLGVLETLSTSNIESNLDLKFLSREGGIILNGYEDGVIIVGLRNAVNQNVTFVCANSAGRLYMKSTPCA